MEGDLNLLCLSIKNPNFLYANICVRGSLTEIA